MWTKPRATASSFITITIKQVVLRSIYVVQKKKYVIEIPYFGMKSHTIKYLIWYGYLGTTHSVDEYYIFIRLINCDPICITIFLML